MKTVLTAFLLVACALPGRAFAPDPARDGRPDAAAARERAVAAMEAAADGADEQDPPEADEVQDARKEGLRLYRLEVRKAPVPTMEGAAPVVAGVLGQSGAAKMDCVDMRSLGSVTSSEDENYFVGEETIGILIYGTAVDAAFESIRRAVCGSTPGCTVSKTSVEIRPRRAFLMSLPKKGAKPARAKISRLGPLPRFSEACLTGLYSDSWNGAGSTPEARKYLEKAKFDRATTRTLSLVNRKGKEMWAFGFPPP